MAVTSTMRTQITQLYVALFGRAPEADGFAYWVGMLESGKTFAQVAQAMYDAPAAKAVYPAFLLNAEIITKFYTNVLGRQPDQAGLDYWTAQLNTKTKGQVIGDMITAVTTYAGTDAAALDSKAFFNDKVDAGLTYVLAGGNDPANKVIDAIVPQAALVEAVTAAAKATADAATAATKANTDAATAAAAVDTTAKASTDAAAKAALTDAAALKTASDNAATAAENAVTTAATKAADVTTAQAALDTAIAGGDTTAINTANAKLLIAQAAKKTADAAVTSTATAATTAKAAYDAAAADDKAATDAAAAAAKAVTDSNTAADAAVTAAAAQAKAAADQVAAAAKTSNTTDDTAATAAVKAAADATTAAASAKATTEVLALATTYATKKAAADQAATDAAAAKTAAAAAITGATSAALAQAAITAAATEQSAAAASKVAADAAKAAADAYAASAAKTTSTTDDTAAKAAVDAATALVSGAVSAVSNAATDVTAAAALPAKFVAQSFTLTKDVDNFVGGAGNDTFSGLYGQTVVADNTFTPLDVIDGGAGAGDTLTLNQVAGGAFPAGTTVKNVEIVNVNAATSASVNTSVGFTGVTNLNVTAFAGGTVTGGTEAIVATNNSTASAITVSNGSAQTITAAGANVTSEKSTGAVTITHTNLGADDILVSEGTNVTVTASKVDAGGTIFVGTTGTPQTGAVVINSTGKASVAGADVTLGAISVKGGTSITVNSVATSSSAAAATDTAGATFTQSAVTVNTTNITKEVTVNQSTAVTEKLAVLAVTGTATASTLTFSAMTVGQSVTVDGLTFTASKTLTAEEAAAAFANMLNGAQQGNAPASNGIYTGTLANYKSGDLSGKTVTFTHKSVYSNNAFPVPTAVGATAPTQSNVVAYVQQVDAVTGKLGITEGQVSITDTFAKLNTVSLSAWGNGSTITADALTTLNLSNNVSDTAKSLSITNNVAKTLALNVTNIGQANTNPTLNTGATYTTLNINTDDSWLDLTAAGVKAMTVTGTGVLDLSGGATAALETVVVTGAAGVSLADSSATLTSIDASASSGGVTANVDATKATVKGSTGADSITTTAAAATKVIDLGSGDDTLDYGTSTSTVTLDGGTGTDTLSMSAANAATASAGASFGGFIQGFEKLKLGQVATTTSVTVNMTNMDAMNHVISGGIAAGAGGALTLNNFINAGTLEFTNAIGTGSAGLLTTVALTDVTGTADSLNIIANVKAASTDAGTVVANGIETISFKAADSDTSSNGNFTNTVTATLKADAVKTINVTGNAYAVLTLDATNIAVTSIDGSAMTGRLTVTTNSAATAATTVKGGSGSDTLTAAHSSDVLVGGAGTDTLTVNGGANLVTLSGGTGNDTFVIAGASTNVNSYATITDINAGDKIKFTGADNFIAAKIALASTAVFQDYANAAVNQAGLTANDLTWFQYGTDTYVVMTTTAAHATFTNGTDMIVKITGLVDLSKSSFSDTADTALYIM